MNVDFIISDNFTSFIYLATYLTYKIVRIPADIMVPILTIHPVV